MRLDPDALRAWPLPAPHPGGDKEDRGRVVIVAGSRECPGGAALAAEAALRAGAGKVLLATVASVAVPLAVAMPELRVVGLPETAGGDIDPSAAPQLARFAGRAAVLLVGPGMLDEAAACALAERLFRVFEGVPQVIDAGALRAAVGAPPPRSAAGRLLLPHAGEMAHLTGASKEALKDDPVRAAREAARRWHATVALKGARTVLAHPDGRAWNHVGGALGLGTAGSGDVLSGLVAGFAARGAPLEQAAAWGIVVHAQAGARRRASEGSLGFLARSIAHEVPRLLDDLGGGAGDAA